jgi:heme-degrading monooxygenase HmoA
MHAVVSRIELATPLEDEAFETAQREMPARLAAIEGIRDFHLVRSGENTLVVVIFGDSIEAIDRLRDEVGNQWMRENVIPHAAGPPDRLAGEVVTIYSRD